eukprot:jgi/Mesen1/5105/ME000254S04131
MAACVVGELQRTAGTQRSLLWDAPNWDTPVPRVLDLTDLDNLTFPHSLSKVGRDLASLQDCSSPLGGGSSTPSIEETLASDDLPQHNFIQPKFLNPYQDRPHRSSASDVVQPFDVELSGTVGQLDGARSPVGPQGNKAGQYSTSPQTPTPFPPARSRDTLSLSPSAQPSVSESLLACAAAMLSSPPSSGEGKRPHTLAIGGDAVADALQGAPDVTSDEAPPAKTPTKRVVPSQSGQPGWLSCRQDPPGNGMPASYRAAGHSLFPGQMGGDGSMLPPQVHHHPLQQHQQQAHAQQQQQQQQQNQPVAVSPPGREQGQGQGQSSAILAPFLSPSFHLPSQFPTVGSMGSMGSMGAQLAATQGTSSERGPYLQAQQSVAPPPGGGMASLCMSSPFPSPFPSHSSTHLQQQQQASSTLSALGGTSVLGSYTPPCLDSLAFLGTSSALSHTNISHMPGGGAFGAGLPPPPGSNGRTTTAAYDDVPTLEQVADSCAATRDISLDGLGLVDGTSGLTTELDSLDDILDMPWPS